MKKFFFAFFVLFVLLGCTQQQAQIQQTENTQASGAVSVAFTVIADGENVVEKTLEVAKGTSALDALKQATEVGEKEFEFGAFVTSIAGIDAGQSNYWAFYVDGQYAEKGLDQYFLEKDSSVRLVLEKIQSLGTQ